MDWPRILAYVTGHNGIVTFVLQQLFQIQPWEELKWQNIDARKILDTTSEDSWTR
jgi:hypothetical protein